MKEHLLTVFALARLSASDRAALQSLIPLASGLGAGTIFGLFFVGRRRAGFAVFEAIAIVAVLVSVASTAYYAIALLHRELRLLTLRPGSEPPRRTTTLVANGDGLFDVTDLVG